VLQSREKLREQFGAREFARFDAFVQRKIVTSMKDVKPLDMHHPNAATHNHKRRIQP
jgi:hypothetical protein